MEKALLEKFVLEGKSTWKIAEETNKAQTTIRYWLKKYGLKTSKIKSYLCKCGEKNPDNFYGKSKQQCKKCFNIARIEVFNKTREKIVEYKGGKCHICNYDKYYGSLELHHLDPTIKDPDFKHIRGWKWERIVKEIDGCILLCGNCHPEVHAGITKISPKSLKG